MADDKRYDAVIEAIRAATEEGSAQGWQGYELQAHAFLAAFDAASGKSAAKPNTKREDPAV